MGIRSSRRLWRLIGVSVLAMAALGAGVMAVPGSAVAGNSAGAIAAPQFADIIEQAQPAVVSINVTKASTMRQATEFGRQQPPEMDEFFRRFFGPGPESRGGQRPVMGVGSGFVVDADGYIVTNNHVIDGADEITIVFDDGEEYEATLVGQDPRTDLAVLKIEADGLPSVNFGDSDAARVGDWVIAIGNPFGLGSTATVGIISARGRDIQSGPYDNFLQIDAPINRGNSGGPVFNTDGEVVGVNTAIFSPNGGNVGIGFAIPSAQVVSIVEELRDTGVVERGWLGVQLQGMDKDLAQSLGLDSSDGALIADVVDDSPADDGGLEIGDVIVTFDGKDVSSPRELSRMVGATDSGQRVKLVVVRNGEEKTLKVELGQVEEPRTLSNVGEPGSGGLGMSLAPVDDAVRARLNLEDSIQGTAVTGVAPGSIAEKNGIRPGDVILRVGDKAISSPEDARFAFAKVSEEELDAVVVLIRRGEVQQFRSLKLA